MRCERPLERDRAVYGFVTDLRDAMKPVAHRLHVREQFVRRGETVSRSLSARVGRGIEGQCEASLGLAQAS